MPVIVIDTSSLIKYLLREEGWRDVSKFLRQNQLVSLEMALIEGANAIWKCCVLHQDISIKTAEKLLGYLHSTKGIIIYENPIEYLPKAEEIALENNVTVYDSLYIAQALKYGKLATSDEKQGKVAEKLGIVVFYL